VLDTLILYNASNFGVWINDCCYFPQNNFICTKEESDDVIDIITKSEEKLAKYYEELNKVKICDKVTYRENQYNLEGIVLDIENGYACVKTYYSSIIGYEYNKVK